MIIRILYLFLSTEFDFHAKSNLLLNIYLMEKIAPVTIATLKEVQKIFDPPISKSTAQRYIKLCRDAIPKQEHQILSVNEFCKYFGLV